MSVVWKDVPGFPNVEACSDGTIRFKDTGHETKGGVAGSYRRVSVVTDKKKGTRRLVYVHDLVCRAFHGKPGNDQVVLHKDDDKLNCRASNLAWGSQSDNIKDAHANGLIKRKQEINIMACFVAILAMDKNGCIGKNNTIPWKCKEDMQFFKEKTEGNVVLMGRKTFESIGKPLPNRRNVVVTRDRNWTHEGVEVIHTLNNIDIHFASEDRDVFIIGGLDIYKQLLPQTHEVFLSRINVDVTDGDTFFDESLLKKHHFIINNELECDDEDSLLMGVEHYINTRIDD